MMEETMKYYKRMLERKERRASRIRQMEHDHGGLVTGDIITLSTLEAEIRLVKDFIEDLEWIQEGAKP